MLGCTHYPLVRDVFEQSIAAHGEDIAVYDPADAVAVTALARHGVLGTGINRFVISQDSPVFHRYVEQMFNGAVATTEIATAATTFSC